MNSSIVAFQNVKLDDMDSGSIRNISFLKFRIMLCTYKEGFLLTIPSHLTLKIVYTILSNIK